MGEAYKTVTPLMFLGITLGTLIGSVLYYFVGVTWFDSPLSYFEYLMSSTIMAVVVVGAFQIFFWVENNNTLFPTRCFKCFIDDWFPFWPSWIWIYSFAYYVVIGLVLVSIQSIEQGMLYVFGAIVLLLMHCIVFYVLPTTVPSSWRKYKADTLSKKFLRFVQDTDCGRNCMPSMHMSVATYTGLLLLPVLGYWTYVYIGLIFLSTLFVKQHQIADLPPGILFGWLVYVFIV